MLSFAGPLAVRLGYDQALLVTVAGSVARAVMQDMRWAVKERHYKTTAAVCPGRRAHHCDRCSSPQQAAFPRRVLEVVSDADAIARILHGARAPPTPPPPGQLLLLP